MKSYRFIIAFTRFVLGLLTVIVSIIGILAVIVFRFLFRLNLRLPFFKPGRRIQNLRATIGFRYFLQEFVTMISR